MNTAKKVTPYVALRGTAILEALIDILLSRIVVLKISKLHRSDML